MICKKMNKKILILSALMLSFNIFPSKITKASTFSESSYTSASDYTELETRIVAESSKQSLEYFQMISRWEVYNASEQEEMENMKEYIQKAKDRYSFVNNYSSDLANEIKYCYEQYIKSMEQESLNGVISFANGSPIFIDFLEKTLPNTQGNFLSFKADGLDKFLNTFIYTNENKIAMNKILEGSPSDKEDGIKELNNTIKNLEEIKTKKVDEKDEKGNVKSVYVSPEVIRNYANEYQNYYKQVIAGSFESSSKLLLHEQYRVEGLIPVGVVSDEMVEFYLYKDVFNSFTDYPSIEVATKIKNNKITKTVNTINKQDIKTPNVQKLKQLHYEFVYQLAEYKKTKDINAVSNAYKEFYNHYSYLKTYYSMVSKRFGNFSSSTAIQEVSKLKEKAKCVDPNFNGIQNLTYIPNYTQDTNSYRQFLVSDNSKFIKPILIGLPIIVVIFILIVVLNKINNKRKYSNSYNDYDNYDDNNW